MSEEPTYTYGIASREDIISIANAIRSKGGTSGSLEFPAGFVAAINNIEVGYVSGDINKTVTGNICGTETQDGRIAVCGNICGDIKDHSSGNSPVICGNICGNTCGDIYGSIYGNVYGDICGNICGDIYGSVVNVYGDIEYFSGYVNSGNIYVGSSHPSSIYISKYMSGDQEFAYVSQLNINRSTFYGRFDSCGYMICGYASFGAGCVNVSEYSGGGGVSYGYVDSVSIGDTSNSGFFGRFDSCGIMTNMCGYIRTSCLCGNINSDGYMTSGYISTGNGSITISQDYQYGYGYVSYIMTYDTCGNFDESGYLTDYMGYSGIIGSTGRYVQFTIDGTTYCGYCFGSQSWS